MFCRGLGIFPTSATKGEGLYEALEWLSAQIKWGRTKQAVTEPVVKSVKEAQKAVQEVSKMKTSGWDHLLHTWKSIFKSSQTYTQTPKDSRRTYM